MLPNIMIYGIGVDKIIILVVFIIMAMTEAKIHGQTNKNIKY